jgi:hypothetical protein
VTKWEYEIAAKEVVGPSYAYTGNLGDMLNEWGQDGWELVTKIAEEMPPTASYQQVTIYTCTFKRPMAEPEPMPEYDPDTDKELAAFAESCRRRREARAEVPV